MNDSEGDTKRSGTTVYLKVPGETFYLDLVRKVIVDLAARMGFPEDEVNKIEMAVDEACTNVIKHAYSGKATDIKIKRSYNLRRKDDMEKAIELSISIDPERIRVVIFDQGEDFNFESQGKINLEEYLTRLEIGSLGIYIIKTFMDEVSYSHKPGIGNELRLVKYLKV